MASFVETPLLTAVAAYSVPMTARAQNFIIMVIIWFIFSRERAVALGSRRAKRARKEEEKRRNRRTIILPSTLYNTSLVSHYRFLGRNFSLSYAK